MFPSVGMKSMFGFDDKGSMGLVFLRFLQIGPKLLNLMIFLFRVFSKPKGMLHDLFHRQSIGRIPLEHATDQFSQVGSRTRARNFFLARIKSMLQAPKRKFVLEVVFELCQCFCFILRLANDNLITPACQEIETETKHVACRRHFFASKNLGRPVIDALNVLVQGTDWTDQTVVDQSRRACFLVEADIRGCNVSMGQSISLQTVQHIGNAAEEIPYKTCITRSTGPL